MSETPPPPLPPPPPKLIRMHSFVNTSQGNEGTCFAHAAARLMARFIKVTNSKQETFPEGEKCDFLYNTEMCGTEKRTIYDCINDVTIYSLEPGKPKCDETESLSALLFYYIYLFTKDIWGCDGGYVEYAMFIFLNTIKNDEEISVDNIKNQLHLKDNNAAELNELITQLKNVLQEFSGFLKIQSESIIYNHRFTDETLNKEFIALLKIALEKGYYAIITGQLSKDASHAVIIQSLDSETGNLVIKNSWGYEKTNIDAMGIKEDHINIDWLTKKVDGEISIFFLNNKEGDSKFKKIDMKTTFQTLMLNRPEIIDKIIVLKGLDLNLLFLVAVKYRNIKTINALKEFPNVDVNAKDEDGKTALMYSAIYGDTKILITLLSLSGIDVNAEDEDGRTALMYSAMNGDKETLTLMLEGIKINAKDKDGRTALMYSAMHGDTETLETLMSVEGIDINTKDNDGRTALMYSAMNEDTETLETLLLNPEIVKNVNDRDNDNYSALDLVGNNPDIIGMLVAKGANYTGQTQKGKLFTSVLKDDLNGVRGVLETDPKLINTEDSHGRTCLIIAIEKKKNEIVKLLLERGIDVNTKDKDGRPAIMHAAQFKNIGAIQELVKQPMIEINAQDKNGKTALMYAIGEFPISQIELVNAILSRSEIDLNLQDKDGKTAIMYAVLKTNKRFSDINLEIVKALLSASAKALLSASAKGIKEINLNLTNKNGNTALDLAEYEDIKELLKSKGATLPPPLPPTANGGRKRKTLKNKKRQKKTNKIIKTRHHVSLKNKKHRK